jgi:TIR domain
MSSLTVREKRVLETFLQMSGGYVLDLSNKSFQEFIFDSTGLDIDVDEVGGAGSKANRLRYFWKNQPDYIVGKLLKEFVDYVEGSSPLKEQFRAIANRLSTGRHITTPADQTRIWGENTYRVFLSHKSEIKKQTGELKEQLEVFGISAFVAHADIEPTVEWQDEIENALASMDAFVALLTTDFHESNWTDQEVGYALGHGVPLIAVKLGKDPYGFIGKFQALSSTWAEAGTKIAKLLIKRPKMLEAFVAAVPECKSYGDGNKLAEILPCVRTLTESQAENLAIAFNTNIQLQGSYGFKGTWPAKFGPGLALHLSRASGKEYELRELGKYSPYSFEIRLKK